MASWCVASQRRCDCEFTSCIILLRLCRLCGMLLNRTCLCTLVLIRLRRLNVSVNCSGQIMMLRPARADTSLRSFINSVVRELTCRFRELDLQNTVVAEIRTAPCDVVVLAEHAVMLGVYCRSLNLKQAEQQDSCRYVHSRHSERREIHRSTDKSSKFRLLLLAIVTSALVCVPTRKSTELPEMYEPFELRGEVLKLVPCSSP